MKIDIRPKCHICKEGIDSKDGFINAWGKSYHFKCMTLRGLHQLGVDIEKVKL
jgi:hypothetical protein